jgi:D-alanyl-D-alanine carboxypeptidase
LQGSGHTTLNTGANAALVYDTDDGKIYYDSGPGAPVHLATLTGAPVIQWSDFTFA